MKEIAKKVGILIITILVVSLLVFLAFQIIPGDPALSKLGMNASPEAVANLREEMGLNRPLLVRYIEWIKSFVVGDMGTSYSYGIPVSELLLDKLPITIILSGMSFLLVILFSIPLGIYTAKHEGGFFDKIIYFFNQIAMAIPAFFLGIILTFFFGLVLKWFVPGGYVSYQINFAKFLGYLIVPAIAIALPKCAMTIKLLRSSILEQSKLEYVRTAYSKGNNTNKVLFLHVLKNAMLPMRRISAWIKQLPYLILSTLKMFLVEGRHLVCENSFSVAGLALCRMNKPLTDYAWIGDLNV